MNKALLLVAMNLFSFVCAIGAIYMAVKGIDGWGYFLFVAVLFSVFPSSDKTE